MSIDYAVAMDMQRICTGESKELSRGQIAGEVVDIEKAAKGLSAEKAAQCRDFYNKLCSDDRKKIYDVDMLLAETESIKKEFDTFIESSACGDDFQKVFDHISEFFMTPPFEGLDNIEYGVNEVCVCSILEYFIWKTTEGYDHQLMRDEYRESIAARTYEEVADHWIGVYDDLQKRYDKLGCGFHGVHALEQKIASCSILAIAAIRDQDAFALDMVQTGADEKGKTIMESYLSDEYEEGESAFTDNVIRLFEFVYGYLKG